MEVGVKERKDFIGYEANCLKEPFYNGVRLFPFNKGKWKIIDPMLKECIIPKKKVKSVPVRMCCRISEVDYKWKSLIVVEDFENLCSLREFIKEKSTVLVPYSLVLKKLAHRKECRNPSILFNKSINNFNIKKRKREFFSCKLIVDMDMIVVTYFTKNLY